MGGFVLLAQPAFLPSEISFFFNLNNGRGAPLDPSLLPVVGNRCLLQLMINHCNDIGNLVFDYVYQKRRSK